MQQAKRRHGLLGTTQGNQVLLDPKGKYIEGIQPRGRRYQIDELAALLDRVHKEYPGHNGRRDDLKLDWFYVDRFAAGARGQLSGSFVSQVDRKPLAIVEGRDVNLLKDSNFLRRHVRQFIWERGRTDGPPRIILRQFSPARTDLATVDLAADGRCGQGFGAIGCRLAQLHERPPDGRPRLHRQPARQLAPRCHGADPPGRGSGQSGRRGGQPRPARTVN
jgi:hypothetical protein